MNPAIILLFHDLGTINPDPRFFLTFVPCFSQTPTACERFDVRGVGLKSGVFIGIVTLRRAVDFETEKHFEVSIRATDGGKRELGKGKQVSLTLRSTGKTKHHLRYL